MYFKALLEVHLPRKLDDARFTDDVDFDFARVLELVFNAHGDIAGELLGFHIGDVSWIDEDADLATSGDGVGFLNAFERVGDCFGILKALDVIFYRVAAGAWAGTGNSIGCLDDN